MIRWMSLLACVLIPSSALANTQPATPTITEPSFDGRVVNAEDAHMETGPFSDADPGDTHVCTDWEIWTLAPAARVWASLCIGGVERLHVHLGDGAFEGSHAGRSSLLHSTNYMLRVRHRDSSGDAGTEWSGWAERFFSTAAASAVLPMELSDVAGSPTPVWLDATGVSPRLTGMAPSARVLLAAADGSPLLEIRAGAVSNILVNPPALAGHSAVRIQIDGGENGVLLPETDLSFQDGTGAARVIALPAVAVAPAGRADYWVAASGATYVGSAAQTDPDFSALARAPTTPWTIAQPGYKVEVVATGFQLPVNIAFIPNPGPAADAPLFYVSELYGTIKLVRRNGAVSNYASGLINFNPTGDFPGSGEQGLTGIVVDPISGDVFAALLYDAAPPNGPHYPKVIRLHSTDGGVTAGSIATIRDMVGESQGQSHQISNLTIGPDGKLYVHMGDGFNAATAQNLSSYRGKILRMNLDGSPPTDNPFYNGGTVDARDFVFALGVRNPFGGGWRASDGQHYEVENGPSVDRLAKITRGTNYGWNGSDASMAINAIYNWNPAHAPVNIVFVQPSTFGGSGFPAQKQDHAFITESGPTWATGPQTLGKRITEVVLDAAGALVSGPTDLIVYSGVGKASAVGLAAGPDGLYFTDLYKDVDFVTPIDPGANVLRVRFVGAASFVADVTSGDAPLTVQFTDQSTVPNANSWLWDFGDGTFSTQRNPSKTYTADGRYNVRLTVGSPSGAQVTQRDGYIRVGPVHTIALVGGALPSAGADAGVASFLRSLGYEVTHFDDEPANRPSASAIAAQFDLAIVSSTITSANVAGQFRTAGIPLIFWEQALLRSDREGLAGDGVVVAGATTIQIVDATHYITQDFSPGAVVAFTTGANLSVGRTPLAGNARLLATRGGAAGDYALLAADQGATLLSGYVTPARRVFFYLEDASWNAATAATRQLMQRSVEWALNITPPPAPCPGDLNGDRTVDLVDLASLLAHYGVSAGATLADGDVNGDGAVDLSDLAFLLANFGAICP